ncbi:MAG: potassium transporter KefB [Pedobacter sp.]|nr:MAG: potassium transporter KefB [Pedobacter sp.]
MSQPNNLPTQIHSAPLNRRMLIGGAIGLVIISLFLFETAGKPEWGAFWKIRPFLIVPAAGAIGGLVYHYMDHLRIEGGWKRVLANVVSLIVFIIGIWMGIVLGLAGTLWD